MTVLTINRIEQAGGEQSHIARKLLEMSPFLQPVIDRARREGRHDLAARLEHFYSILTR